MRTPRNHNHRGAHDLRLGVASPLPLERSKNNERMLQAHEGPLSIASGERKAGAVQGPGML
jgi:hypothetical protein